MIIGTPTVPNQPPVAPRNSEKKKDTAATPSDRVRLGERLYAGGNGAFIMAIPAAIGEIGRQFGPYGQVAGAVLGTAATLGVAVGVAHIADGHLPGKYLAGLGVAAAASSSAAAVFGWQGALGATAAGFGAGALLG
jgi:hypothetical protein